MEKNASIYSKNFQLWETELSEVDKLCTFCRLHWSLTAALWFQYWVTFSGTTEKFLSLKKADKKLFPWSPEPPSLPTTLKMSLPSDPTERRALEGEYSVFTSFLYTLIFRSEAFKWLGADWLRGEMTLTLLKKEIKNNKKSPAVQALQPLAELQIPQIFYKTLYPFDGIFDNSFISFMLGGKKERKKKRKKERTCASNREYFC